MKAIFFALPFALIAKDISIELDKTLPLTLECTGKYRILYNDRTHKTDYRFAKKARLQEKNLGLVWGDDINPYDAFTIVPLNGSRILINGIEFKGSLDFAYSQKIINHVNIDLVVQSIMEKQDFSHLSLEALKALACVIRTDLSSDSRTFTETELDYDGSSLLYQYPKTVQAVVETKNMVMTYNQKPFPATYCVDAAGHTASFSDIFRLKAQVPQGKSLPELPSVEWKVSLKKSDLLSKLNLDNLKNLSFYTDKKSQKIYAVKIEDSSGQRVLLIERFMQLLGLKSNNFSLSNSSDEFTFSGKGEGLGVGLCLKTAENMSKKGADYQDILKSCFSDVEISLLDN